MSVADLNKRAFLMRVDHLPFSPFVNASEERAYQHLSRQLMAEAGDARFVILTNVAHSVTSGGQADEIDIVLIGRSGVHVVEVKHWDRAYVRSNRDVVAAEADKIALKVRKVAAKLRRRYPDLGYLEPKMLLTKEQKTLQRDTDEPIRGVRLYALTDWRKLVDLDDLSRLPEARIDQLCAEIAPRSRAVLSGELRRLGQIADLALLSPRADRFHRTYRGRNTVNQDQVVVHLYDLSASEHENPGHLARREFDVVQRMQKSPWLSRLVDSFQPAPNYPGELFFFSLADSSAPTLRARARDTTWTLEDRLEFARRCLVALDELHSPASEEEGVIHRTITPDAILVRPDGRPLFFHWEWARIPEAQTIAPPATVMLVQDFAAPEVLAQGLSSADRRSDVYALCASLRLLFEGIASEEAREATQVLALGTAADPEKRPSLVDLADLLSEVCTKPPVVQSDAVAPARPAQAWAEEGVVNVDGHHYRVLVVCL